MPDNSHSHTYRVCSPELEKIMGEPLRVLDHGFIRVIDYMGNDASIVQAARVSYGAGTKKSSEDKALIHYLMRHSHSTPFEMCDIKLHVKLPIFVARQWMRHRTASINEYSARYSILSREFYCPEKNHISAQSSTNSQGRNHNSVSDLEAEKIIEIIKKDANQCYDNYEYMLNSDLAGNVLDDTRHGIARELARMNLTLNYYTEMYWKINLHNLMHFTRLRADSHAQYEIRVYAEKILDIISKWVPYTAEAFKNYKINGVSISSEGLKIIKQMISGKTVDRSEFNMGKREWNELMVILDMNEKVVS